MTIRLCLPFEKNNFLHSKNTSSSELNFEIHKTAIDIVHLITKIYQNTIVTNEHKVNESEKTSSIEKCIDRLKNNQSDILLFPIDYPLNINDVEQGYIISESKIVFSQLHLAKTMERNKQLSHPFSPFHGAMLYILIFLLLTTILLHTRKVIFSKLRNEIFKIIHNRKRRHVLIHTCNCYYVLSHAFRHGSIPTKGIFFRLIFISLSTFSMLIINFYASSINTSLVVVFHKPKLYSTYKDLWDNQVVPVFFDGQNLDSYFINSKSNSIKRNYYNWAMNKFGPENMYISKDTFKNIYETEQVFDKINLSLKGKMVFISDSYSTNQIEQLICYLMKISTSSYGELFDQQRVDKLKRSLIHTTSDPFDNTIQKSILINKLLSKQLKKKVLYLYNSLVENGLMFKKLTDFGKWNHFNRQTLLKKTTKLNNKETTNCKREITNQSELKNKINLRKIRKLYSFYYILIFFCSMVYYFEKLVDNLHRESELKSMRIIHAIKQRRRNRFGVKK